MAVMNTNEILRRGATTAQPNQFNLALPKLPTAVQTYTPYTQMDPANYIANVAGFLPINVQHMSNTTNGYAYNSLADVVFNYKAWQKRWGENSWLNTPIGYIPRVIADTGLLLKDTIANPVVDSVKLALSNPNDDLGLLKGLSAGVNTAVLNTLVNVGNSVDFAANPIKGLLIDGPEGFARGLVGVEDGGRKQYDFSNVIDFGPGFTAGVGELLTSTVLEFVSDPLNWISLGASTVAKTGASVATDAVTAGLKTTLREAVDQGLKASDKLADALVKATNGALKTADATAILKQVTNDSGEIVSESVENYLKNVDDLTSSIIQNTVKSSPGKNFKSSLNDTATTLKRSTDTRYRAGLIKKVDYTPAAQKTSAALLKNVDADMIPKSVLTINKLNNTADKITAYAALIASGALPIHHADRFIIKPAIQKAKQAKLERYVKYITEHADEVRELLGTLDNEYKLDFAQLLDEQSLDAIVNLKQLSSETLSNVDAELNEAINAYSVALATVSESTRGDDKIMNYLIKAQQKALEKVNQTISKMLHTQGVHNLTEYVEYVHNSLRLNPTSAQLQLLDKKLKDINKLLTADLTDVATLELHKNSSKAFNSALDVIGKQYNWTQEKSMADAAARVKEYRKLQNIQIDKAKKVELYNAAVDDAVEYINNEYGYITNTLPRLINSELSDTYPDTTSDVLTDAVGERIIDTNHILNEAYNNFKEAYNAYNEAISADDTVSDVLKSGDVKPTRSIKPLDKSKRNIFEGKKLTKKKTLTPEQAMVNYVIAYNNLREQLIRLKFKDNPLSTSAYKRDLIHKIPEAKTYIEKMQSFTDVVNPDKANDFVKLSDYFDAQLVSYTMRVSATKFALDLIQDTGVETTTRQINVAEYILELNRSGKSSAEIAETLKQNKCVLFNTGDDFVWTETEVDDIINIAHSIESKDNAPNIAYAQGSSDTASLTDVLYKITKLAPTINKSPVLDSTFSPMVEYTDVISDVLEMFTSHNINPSQLLTAVENLAKTNPSLEDAVTLFIDTYNKIARMSPLDIKRQHTYAVLGWLQDLPNSPVYIQHLIDLDMQNPDLADDLIHLSQIFPETREAVAVFIKNYNTILYSSAQKLTSKTYVKLFDNLKSAAAELVQYNATSVARANKLFDRFKASAETLYNGLSGRTLSTYADDMLSDSRTPFANLEDFLEGYYGTVTETRPVNSALMKVVNAAKDPNSGIYKLLNAPETENLMEIQLMKATLTRLDDFKTLVDNYNAFLDRTPMTTVQREAFIDALVTQIKRGHRFKEDKLLAIANEMYDGAALYYRTHMDIDSFAADNQFIAAASKIAKDSPKAPIAAELLSTLKAGIAHMADVDNDNLWRYILLNDDLYNIINASAGSRYRVIFDTETTGDIDDPLTKVFQLAVKILDVSGNEVKRLNYIIDPGDAKPSHTILKKVAPSTSKDIDAWWLDNIVNNPDKLPDFNTAVDALYKELNSLDATQGFMFIGQNITNFDMKLLYRHGSSDFIKLLDKSKSLDTLQYLMSLNTPELFGTRKEWFIDELAQFFMTMKQSKNTALLQDTFTYKDVKNFSEVKDLLSGTSTKFSKSERTAVGDLVESMRVSGNTDSGSLTSITMLEDCIDSVVSDWGQARATASTIRLYTATKASLADEEARQAIHALLQNQRINIDVPIGSNIMTYVNRYVNSANVMLNPRTAISFELENIFSRSKLEEAFPDLVVSKEFATGLTFESRAIMHLRSNLTPSVVESLKDEATIFFKSDAAKFGNAQYVYDAAEDNADIIVAAYLYYKYPRSSERYAVIFDHMGTKLLHKRTASGNVPLAYTEDPHTGRPKAMFADDNLYSYRQKVEATKYNPLDAITEYNVDRNIYNAHSAALSELHKHNSALMLEVEAYLKRFSNDARVLEERKFRSYNKVLSEVAKQELLERDNRVDALIKEAKLRFGRVCFSDSKDLDLSDFIAKGIYVHKTAKTNAGEIVYVYKLCIPKNLWDSAEDLVLQPTVFKQLDGVSDEAVQLINKARQLNATYVYNVGKSRGDVITKELLDEFDADLPKEILAELISKTELESAGYFDKLRANHTFIWSTELQEVSDNFITSDPFNQAFYNTERFMKQRYGLLASYLNLLYNEANDINGALFKDILPKDLVSMFKKSDMVVVYLQPSTSIWAKTNTGVKGASYRLKTIDIINERSIELAQSLGAHVLPRTQYLQMAHAINTFELPPIAKIASAISTYYKLGYLSSIGFIVRNILDSNYKNRLALDGNVSLPKQIHHLFDTIHLLQDYNTLGQTYTKYMGQYFKSELEYDVFYNICQNIKDPNVKTIVSKNYSMRLQKQVNKYIDKVLTAFKDNINILETLNKRLIDKKLFTCVDTFVQYGPSVGLNRSVLENIATPKGEGLESLNYQFIKLVTEKSPMRFVYDWNDMVEQSARLSLFLQRLEAGDTIDTATRAVIKTHFDYSDKSLEMLYVETVLPFMSFSYKNLEFWVDTVYKNPKLLREFENILRPGIKYDSLFNPDQEAYKNFDYTFDWSKDVISFEARAPWQMINAARLYHILSGNFIIDTGKTVRYDNGYGEQDAELYAVFKLSPSVLDAVRMLYNPIDTYQQRLLPPVEVLTNTLINVLEGKAPIEDVSVNAFLNQLPLIGAPLQRLGIGSKSDNNIVHRVQDLGLPAAVSSLFTAAYVPKKDHVYIYDEDYNVLNPKETYPRFNKMYYRGGGFSMNYLARRTYSSIYSPDTPTYRIIKYARRLPNKSPYRKFKRTQVKTYYFNSLHYGMRDKLIKYRVADKFRRYN